MGIIYVKHIPTVELVFGVTKSADTRSVTSAHEFIVNWVKC